MLGTVLASDVQMAINSMQISINDAKTVSETSKAEESVHFAIWCGQGDYLLSLKSPVIPIGLLYISVSPGKMFCCLRDNSSGTLAQAIVHNSHTSPLIGSEV